MTILVDTKPRIQFLLLPKTGCTWIANLLRDGYHMQFQVAGEMHCLANHTAYREQGYYGVTILRDPFTWLSSLYAYCTRGEFWRGVPGPAQVLSAVPQTDFGSWVEWVAGKPGAVRYVYEAYAENADRVLWTEKLHDDAREFFDDIGWSGEVARRYPRQNTTPERPDIEWTPALRKLIEESQQCESLVKGLKNKPHARMSVSGNPQKTAKRHDSVTPPEVGDGESATADPTLPGLEADAPVPDSEASSGPGIPARKRGSRKSTKPSDK